MRRLPIALYIAGISLLVFHYPGLPVVGSPPERFANLTVAVAVLLLAGGAWLGWLHQRRQELIQIRSCRGLCVACGYDMTHNTSGVCPECGTPVNQQSKAGA